jgi:hypothetical protein
MAARSLYRGRGMVDYLQGKVYAIMWNVSWDFTWLRSISILYIAVRHRCQAAAAAAACVTGSGGTYLRENRRDSALSSRLFSSEDQSTHAYARTRARRGRTPPDRVGTAARQQHASRCFPVLPGRAGRDSSQAAAVLRGASRCFPVVRSRWRGGAACFIRRRVRRMQPWRIVPRGSGLDARRQDRAGGPGRFL